MSQKITSDMFAPPYTKENGSTIEVRLPRHLRDNGWSNGVGAVQNDVSIYAKTMATANSKTVVFDFTSCRWVDPLPLMSMLIEIVAARDLGLAVNVSLPQPDSGSIQHESGYYHESPNRMLRYLAKEGFSDCLDILMKHDKFVFCSSKPIDGWAAFGDLQVKPSYEDAQCIPMRLINIPKDGEEFAKESVDTLLVGVDSRLEAKIAPQTRERLISKLRVALQEVLHNAQEHAYDSNTLSRPLLVYARYRAGGVARDSTGKQIFTESIEEEKKHCPRLRAEWLTDRSGCLELFVLDRGIGMVRSFEKAGIPLSHKYKFNEVLQKTFGQGISAKPKRETLYGGLHLLHNLLKGGYLRALEGNLWVGHGIPLQRTTEGAFRHTGSASMQGLAMHFRLGWKEETDHGDEWAKFEQGENSEVWRELNLSEDDCAPSIEWFKRKKVIDERFGEMKEDGSESDWVLWLVGPHRMKWDILTFIRSKIAPLASGATTLVIADIPSHEAKIYEAALESFKAVGNEDWPLKFSRVILVTNRWRFATVHYELHEKRHGFSTLHSDFAKLRVLPLPIYPKPKNFRLGIVRWMKWHDSRRIWEEVEHSDTMFIPEKVGWGSDETG